MTSPALVATPVAFKRRVPKPWGHELIFTPTSLPYAGKVLHVAAGKRLSLQIHDVKTETLLLLSGSAWLLLEGDSGELWDIEMELGVGYTVAPGRKHRITAISDSMILECSTPETGTTIRLEDDYGRPDETEAARQLR